MTEAEIAERFIRAAEIDRATVEHVGPQRAKSAALPYVHDWIDKVGWGDKRLEEERREFFEAIASRPTSADLSEAASTFDLIKLVPDQSERRCLLAWARSKAGGKAFKRWCFDVEGIHPETGRRRKDRAVETIERASQRNTLLRFDNRDGGVLLDHGSDAYLEPTFAEPPTEPKRGSWKDDPSLRPVMDEAQRDLTWAEQRNEARRKRSLGAAR
jgi:hypothetical protein